MTYAWIDPGRRLRYPCLAGPFEKADQKAVHPVSLVTPISVRGPNASVKTKRPSERRSLSRSATRALDVLELFGRSRQALRAVEIGRALTLNPSSTNQILKTMVDSGHLVFDARGKTYLPSPRLGEFSSWIVATYGAGGRLRKLIAEIHECTGMVVTVTTPNDLFMQIIDSAIPGGDIAERGLKVSVFGSAIGSAYLSMLDDDEVRRLADRARFPPDEIPHIVDSVAQIRRDGFADGPSSDGGVWSLAVPLPELGLSIPTVLGLAGLPESLGADVPGHRRIMDDAIERWLSA